MQRTTVGIGIALLTVVGMWQAGVATAGGCPVALPQGSEPVTLDPADFVERIDNPYLRSFRDRGGSTARPTARVAGSG